MIKELPEKIAIFRALQLGDMLCAIPAVRALRRAMPGAEITLLGLPWAGALVQRFDMYFDRFIHFPGYPGLPEQKYDESAWRFFLEEMQAESFDLLLQMQGNGTIVNNVLRQFGARQLAGFHNKDSRADSPLFVEYPEHIHEIERHLLLMRHLGIPDDGVEMEFPLKKEDYEALARLKLPLKAGRYVCVHPGSRGRWRQWPPPYFAMLADHCADRGYDIVITGTGEEKDIAMEVIKNMHHPVIDLTGRTGLGAMGALLKDAAMLISNCTGVSHMAAALHTPSVIISMDGEPYRWGALNRQLHKTVDWNIHSGVGEALLQLNTLMLDRTPLVAGGIL